MQILAIETSCDETSASVVKNGRKIITNIVSSSLKLHEKTGGIIPEVAAREQIKYILPALSKSLQLINKFSKELKKKVEKDIDAIAVTIGPGLIGSLLVGVETAKTVSYVNGKPLIPVNHIHAHLYANWLDVKQIPAFPAVGLVVSGGHTELFLLHSHMEMKWLGGTLDDAAGEAFDKTARLLGLGYPGGPAIAAEAANSEFRIQNSEFRLPRPMINSKDLNFSFSGLKTAVLREVQKMKNKNKFSPENKRHLAYEIQEAITDVLVAKTLAAAKQYNVKSILLGGGVAANQCLKEKLKFQISNFKFQINLHVPPPSLCTDNAAYIAAYAYFHPQPVPWEKVQAIPDLEIEV